MRAASPNSQSQIADDVRRYWCDGCQEWLEGQDRRIYVGSQLLCPQCVRRWLRARPNVTILQRHAPGHIVRIRPR